MLDSDLASFKTRVIALETFAVGAGEPDNGFVHIELGVLSGREATVKATAAEIALSLVRAHVGLETGSPLQLTVEVREMDASVYRKATLA